MPPCLRRDYSVLRAALLVQFIKPGHLDRFENALPAPFRLVVKFGQRFNPGLKFSKSNRKRV